MSIQWQVYFAEEKYTGLIKIGCTANTLAKRMDWLRWNGDTQHSMNLWWAIPVSDKKAERWFQRYFAAHRTKEKRTHSHEWFKGITVDQVKEAIGKYILNGRKTA